MYAIDVAVTQAINQWAGHNPLLDGVMVALSTFAVPLLVLAVAGQWWRGAERLHYRHILLATGFSFLLGLAFNQLVLLFVHRLRPYDAGISHLLVARSADPSFPSDHATASFAIAAAFLVQGARRMGLAFLVAALLVGLSRIYVGAHYASDVLGGAATGVLAAFVVRAVYWESTFADRFLTKIL